VSSIFPANGAFIYHGVPVGCSYPPEVTAVP
jgi:hypothetical protein